MSTGLQQESEGGCGGVFAGGLWLLSESLSHHQQNENSFIAEVL